MRLVSIVDFFVESHGSTRAIATLGEVNTTYGRLADGVCSLILISLRAVVHGHTNIIVKGRRGRASIGNEARFQGLSVSFANNGLLRRC